MGRVTCPHCEISERATAPSQGGPNGITEAAILRGTALMTRLDPERTPQQHEAYVRAIIQGVREHLVQRHLYDAVVGELRRDREAA